MKLFPNKGNNLSFLGAYIAYPIGKILLKAITIGKYPPEAKKHNEMLVAIFPLVTAAVLATFIMS